MTIDRQTVIRLADDCKRAAQPFKRPGYDGPYLDLLKSIGKLTALVLEHGRKPLTPDVSNVEGINARIHFRRGWHAAETAHGITNKETTK